MTLHRPSRGWNDLDVARESVTVADCRQPDMPIIYANQGFERVTGYTPDEVLGRNCRFLQGDDHDQDGVQQIRAAIVARRPCVVELSNYKKSGARFKNRLSLTPVFDRLGNMVFLIGLQHDVTRLRNLEEILVRHLHDVLEAKALS